MKPKPFSALNHFTVPWATCSPTFRACGRPHVSWGRGLALPPAEHARGTRTARDGTSGEGCREYIHAAQTPDRDVSVTQSGDRPDPTPGPAGPGSRLTDQTGRADRLQRGLHVVRGADDRLQRGEGLEALSRVEDDGLLRGVEPPVADQLTQHRDGDPTGGLGEHAGGA